MDPAALSERRRQLQARAEQQGIDLHTRFGGLPLDDDGVVVGALATLLGLPIASAFDAAIDVDELTRLSEVRRAEQLTTELIEQYVSELRQAGGQSGR